MRKALLVVFLAMVFLCPAAHAGLSDFAGTWKNADANTRGITTLKVTVDGGAVQLQAWGKCSPEDCDWGSVPAQPYGPGVSADIVQSAKYLSAVFRSGFKETLIIITKPRSGRLKAQSFTRFTDNSARSNYQSTANFRRELALKPAPLKPVRTMKQVKPLVPVADLKPAPLKPVELRPARLKEDCVGFDWHNLRVKKINDRWKIVEGSHWIMDFGANEAEARKARRILRHYRVTSRCFVGRPDPSLTYLLCDGAAPAGRLPGEDCIAFDLDAIAVSRVGGRWKIVEGDHWLFDFGSNEAEARKAFNIIKQHGFNRTCYVGRPHASMTYLRR